MSARTFYRKLVDSHTVGALDEQHVLLRWLRKNLEQMSAAAQKTLPQASEANVKMEKIA